MATITEIIVYASYTSPASPDYEFAILKQKIKIMNMQVSLKVTIVAYVPRTHHIGHFAPVRGADQKLMLLLETEQRGHHLDVQF
jgi:hypothetical protein